MRRADLGGGQGVYLAIVSAGRPERVAPIQALTGPASWYVPAEEVPAYHGAGAARVVAAGALCPSRNRALHDAWAMGLSCVQVSDDLVRLRRVRLGAGGKPERASCTWGEAIAELVNTTHALDARLGGVACTDNLLSYHAARPVSTSAFILGDLMYIRPCTLLFDERLSLKEDYDYTLQHLTRYGVAARANGILASFLHRTNHGGAVATRTAEREEEAIAYLRAKWGTCIRPHPTRAHEVLMRWPHAHRTA